MARRRSARRGNGRGTYSLTLPGSCGLLSSSAGALRLASCDQRWFDLRGAGALGFEPRLLDVREERWRAADASVDPPEGTSFTARCPELPPVTLGARADRKPAAGPTDPSTARMAILRSVGRSSGSYQSAGLSPSGRFAVVHEVEEYPGQPSSENVVAVHVQDLKKRRELFVVHTNEEGFAFDPEGRAPRPRADGQILDARASASGGQCDLFIVTPSGAFEGEPHGALGFRLGDDLRRSEVVSGPMFEARRRKSLVEEFFMGK